MKIPLVKWIITYIALLPRTYHCQNIVGVQFQEPAFPGFDQIVLEGGEAQLEINLLPIKRLRRQVLETGRQRYAGNGKYVATTPTPSSKRVMADLWMPMKALGTTSLSSAGQSRITTHNVG